MLGLLSVIPEGLLRFFAEEKVEDAVLDETRIQWRYMSYGRRICFLRLLRQEDKRKNGFHWNSLNLAEIAEESDVFSIPEYVSRLLFITVKKNGCLSVPFLS